MGIDIYARWKGQTEKEREAQITGMSGIHGHVGYLREAYHGAPYATPVLVWEAFRSATDEATIPAGLLRARLPLALHMAELRQRQVYGETDEHAIRRVQRSFTDFVELCEAKEWATEEPCTIVADYRVPTVPEHLTGDERLRAFLEQCIIHEYPNPTNEGTREGAIAHVLADPKERAEFEKVMLEAERFVRSITKKDSRGL